jgi:hypothetical protein
MRKVSREHNSARRSFSGSENVNFIAITAIHFHNLNICLHRPFWFITLTSFETVKQYTMRKLRQQYNLTFILELPDLILGQIILL